MLRSPRLAAALAATVVLAACSDNSTSPDASTEPAENFRRLFVADNAAGVVRAYNLNDLSSAGEMTLGRASTYFYPTGSGRFIVAHQQTGNRVDVIDAGVFATSATAATRRAPAMAHFFGDSVPIHGISAGNIFAVFFDGTGTTQFFDETRLATGVTAPLARIVKGATHGASLGLGNRWLLATPPMSGSPLPTGINVYNLTGSLVDSVRNCPQLHGAHATLTHAAFGCLDGVVIAQMNGTSNPTWSKRNYTDTRFRTGTVWGRESSRFLLLRSTIPGQPTSNTTRRLGVYDTQTGTMDFLPQTEGSDIEWTAGLSADGTRTVAIGRSGTLYIYDNATRTQVGKIDAVVPGFTTMPSGVASWLEFAEDRVYISAPTQNQVVEVRISGTPAVLRRLTVPGVPTRLAIGGIRSGGRFTLQ